ncbi:MAG: hypothetical protein ACE1Z6_01045, partial [Candidatus Methylomirabilales bacterium]
LLTSQSKAMHMGTLEFTDCLIFQLILGFIMLNLYEVKHISMILEKEVPDTFFAVAAFQTLILLPPHTKIASSSLLLPGICCGLIAG